MVFFGFAGSVFSKLIGGFTNDLKTLILLMATDFITGIIVAGIFKKSLKSPSGALQSKASFKGISRKCITITFVMIAHRIDILLGVDFVRSAVIFAYIANELISITENAGLMGVPVPDVIKKAIDVLKSKSDSE